MNKICPKYKAAMLSVYGVDETEIEMKNPSYFIECDNENCACWVKEKREDSTSMNGNTEIIVIPGYCGLIRGGG